MVRDGTDRGGAELSLRRLSRGARLKRRLGMRARRAGATTLLEQVQGSGFPEERRRCLRSRTRPICKKPRRSFQYGNDAALKSNFDYAIDMYKQACKIVPDNLVYRQALRGIERRKFNNDPGKVGMLVGAKNQPILLRAKTPRSKEKFAEAIELCEDAFVNNPWDVGAARVAAEAAEGLGLLVLAQWFVESVRGGHQGRRFPQVRRADSRGERKLGEGHRAAGSRSRSSIPTIRTPTGRSTPSRPLDDQAGQARRRPGRSSRRGRDAEPAESMEAKLERLKQEQLTPEQRLIKEIMADPKAVHAYLELADIYRRHSDFDKAEKVLAKGLKANPDDPALQCGLRGHPDQPAEAGHREPVAASAPASRRYRAKAKLDQLTEMFNKYEVEAFRRRVKLHPDDPERALQLGMILARVGDHDGAIAEFQQARTSRAVGQDRGALSFGPQLRGQQRLKLAERNYKEALEAARARRQGQCSSRCIIAWAGRPSRWATTRPPKSTTTRSPPSITRISTSPQRLKRLI